ncbi:hypothetical protein NK6_1437 [Bradyrhizobium diazoefficiens]|uniref:Uncharacterized protein n=1 Tax=Bradyrhizobium diazoefficiens TaxID=1355477 RepID=A0A0E4BKP9_9BRAD|nr:hypothetical protein NK6_1437 [Bradyrhizobium diazoefficiens]
MNRPRTDPFFGGPVSAFHGLRQPPVDHGTGRTSEDFICFPFPWSFHLGCEL